MKGGFTRRKARIAMPPAASVPAAARTGPGRTACSARPTPPGAPFRVPGRPRASRPAVRAAPGRAPLRGAAVCVCVCVCVCVRMRFHHDLAGKCNLPGDRRVVGRRDGRGIEEAAAVVELHLRRDGARRRPPPDGERHLARNRARGHGIAGGVLPHIHIAAFASMMTPQVKLVFYQQMNSRYNKRDFIPTHGPRTLNCRSGFPLLKV